jgi:hypothetical protein
MYCGDLHGIIEFNRERYGKMDYEHQEPVVRKRKQASSRSMGTVDPEKDNNYRTGGLE